MNDLMNQDTSGRANVISRDIIHMSREIVHIRNLFIQAAIDLRV